MDKDTQKTRRPYHHGDLRTALVVAAETLLRDSGTWTFTLREVARAAGVSHNAPYNHFADKRALLAAVAIPGFTALQLALASSEGATGKERMTALARAYVRFGVTNPAMFRLMFSEELAPSDDLPELRIAAAGAFDVLRETVYGSVTDTQPAESHETDALTAWALVHGMTHLILDGRVPLPDQEGALETLVTRIGQTLLDGMMH